MFERHFVGAQQTVKLDSKPVVVTIIGLVDGAGLGTFPPPGMQIRVLTRIDRCRYFRDSSLHFFLWLYNRILARKTHCVASGRTLVRVSQKAHRLFQNLPFLS